MDTKDCEIIFCNKQTYQFSSKDLAKALAWGKDKNIWAIKTPWMILTVMDPEEFEHVSDAMFEEHQDPAEIPEDLVV